ncbi:hypothetical protein ACFPRL_05460 [Pseudoclavibacter helvolus]
MACRVRGFRHASWSGGGTVRWLYAHQASSRQAASAACGSRSKSLSKTASRSNCSA